MNVSCFLIVLGLVVLIADLMRLFLSKLGV